MEAPTGEYRILGQVHLNRLGLDGSITPGWEITVHDNLSGTNFPVFVADDKYNAENAKVLIEHQLHLIRGVHALDGQ